MTETGSLRAAPATTVATASVGWTLAALTTASRLPFLATQPVTFDTGNLALAVSRFDVSIHQPQPPGYVYFVLVARALRGLVADPSLALGLQAALWSGIAVLLVYRLTLALATPRAALWAALLLATNPLFWFHGEVGLVYTAGAAMGLASAWAAVVLRTQRVSVVRCLVIGLALGLLGGFRGSDAVFLLPLIVWGSLRGGPRRLATVAAGWGIGMSSWIVLTRLLSPPAPPTLGYLATVAGKTSVFFGADLAVHLGWTARLAFFLACSVGIPGLLALVASPRHVHQVVKDHAWLWLLWVAPATAFFALIHYTNPGHPLLLIGAPAAISGIVLAERPRLAVVAALAGAAWFLLAPDRLSFTTRARLVASDATRNQALAEIEKSPGAEVVLLTRTGARSPMSRGPDYRFLSLRLDRSFYVLTFGPGPAHLNRVSVVDGRVEEARLPLPDTVLRADDVVFVVHKALLSDLAGVPVENWNGYVARARLDAPVTLELPGDLTFTIAPTAR